MWNITPSSDSMKSLNPNPNPFSSPEVHPSDSGEQTQTVEILIVILCVCVYDKIYIICRGFDEFITCCLISGRTQRQVFDYVKDSEFKKIPFER